MPSEGSGSCCSASAKAERFLKRGLTHLPDTAADQAVVEAQRLVEHEERQPDTHERIVEAGFALSGREAVSAPQGPHPGLEVGSFAGPFVFLSHRVTPGSTLAGWKTSCGRARRGSE